MKRYLALLAILTTSVVPMAARADLSDPVTLSSCGLTYDTTKDVPTRINGLAVDFTNEGPKTAQVVNIRAVVAGQPELIRDVGTFSPGIEIKHHYRTGQGQFALPAILGSMFTGAPTVTCTIDSVVWDDNTKWTPTQTGTAVANGSNPSAITSMPSALLLNGTGAASARLFYASGGGSLSFSSDCGKIANVEVLATTSRELAVKVTGKAGGSCHLTVRDANDNFSTVPVTISP